MIKTFVKDLKREFKGYNGKSFSKDLMAGLTVTAVALPLALAFGVSSGADAAAGLITAIIAGFVISAFAGASFQISGPTGAMTAVLITIVARFGMQGVFVACLMAGILLVLFGLFKMGNLVSFIPMLMGTGGNSGAQASTAVIRSISLGDVEPKDVISVLWKEWRVALLAGVSLAAVNFVKMLVVDQMLLHNSSVTLIVAATVSASIVFIVMFAKVVGSSLPILAEKIGVDPAVMANPLISTITDAVSLVIYFTIARLLLHI